MKGMLYPLAATTCECSTSVLVLPRHGARHCAGEHRSVRRKSCPSNESRNLNPSLQSSICRIRRYRTGKGREIPCAFVPVPVINIVIVVLMCCCRTVAGKFRCISARTRTQAHISIHTYIGAAYWHSYTHIYVHAHTCTYTHKRT